MTLALTLTFSLIVVWIGSAPGFGEPYTPLAQATAGALTFALAGRAWVFCEFDVASDAAVDRQ